MRYKVTTRELRKLYYETKEEVFKNKNTVKKSTTSVENSSKYDVVAEDVFVEMPDEFNESGERKVNLSFKVLNQNARTNVSIGWGFEIDGQRFFNDIRNISPSETELLLKKSSEYSDFYLSPGKHTIEAYVNPSMFFENKGNNTTKIEIEVTPQIFLGEATPEEEPAYNYICQESDGGDDMYGVGTTVFKINDSMTYYTDFCGANDVLTEYTCTDDHRVINVHHDCEYGCSAGKCISEAPTYKDLSIESVEISENPTERGLMIRFDVLTEGLEMNEEFAAKVMIYDISGKEVASDIRGLKYVGNSIISSSVGFGDYSKFSSEGATYTVKIMADSAHNIYEMSENNNVFTKQFYLSPKVSEEPTYNYICEESDMGDDIYGYGTTVFKINDYITHYTDSCGANDVLTEYTCTDDGRVINVHHDCEYGCSAGKCLSSPQNIPQPEIAVEEFKVQKLENYDANGNQEVKLSLKISNKNASRNTNLEWGFAINGAPFQSKYYYLSANEKTAVLEYPANSHIYIPVGTHMLTAFVKPSSDEKENNNSLDREITISPETFDTNIDIRKVSFWHGKVNQHFENGQWMTDSDGYSGAHYYSDRKLQYCQKFWPETTDVVLFNDREYITDWKDAGNVSSYKNYKPSYECVR
ncbi:hypothetical protein HN954_01280 [bacterium]|nr:hypothetical protein [bacterium]MBT6831490.1 hypothetical protein [bacterium]MBT6996044.1 hypothetical protein [bacterium]MBT7772165.1 hypothetical protein [bacterium]